jgi:hypothetical protein
MAPYGIDLQNSKNQYETIQKAWERMTMDGSFIFDRDKLVLGTELCLVINSGVCCY